MRPLLEGTIEENVPIFNAHVGKDGALVLGEGAEALTVDTGFNGGVVLPEGLLAKLDLIYLGTDRFRLAMGEEVELPVFWGRVRMNGREFQMWFAPGDSIVGMEFLAKAGSELWLGLETGRVVLSG